MVGSCQEVARRGEDVGSGKMEVDKKRERNPAKAANPKSAGRLWPVDVFSPCHYLLFCVKALVGTKPLIQAIWLYADLA